MTELDSDGSAGRHGGGSEVVVVGGGGGNWWMWAAASSAQLAVGIASVRRGCSESGSAAMPAKAFAVASLFVGAGATAAFASLRAAGISTVEDMKEVGESIRVWMRAPPRRTVDSQSSKS